MLLVACPDAPQVRILRLLQHSNVVSIHQFFQDDPEYYYMVMEYMSGGELFDRIVQKVREGEKGDTVDAVCSSRNSSGSC